MRYLALILSLSFSFTAFADDDSWKAIFSPLPKVADSKENPVTPEKVTLGRKLFSDTRLSMDKDLSCNSCHNLATYGVDNEPTSIGHKKQRGGRNSPTVYNSALHFLQFWDGRAKDVEEQALGPVLNPVEMAMPKEEIVMERLREDPLIVESFKKAFPEDKDPMTFKNMGKAIGAFERTLLTPSRFDKFLEGDATALTPEEKAGAKKFVETGCVTCHMGSTVGGTMFQKLGLIKPYATKDLGRFEVTKNEADKFYFKVPSLRNVEKTAPYFHDGSIKTLEEAVHTMGEYQLGRNLSDKEVGEIVTFLKALTADKLAQ